MNRVRVVVADDKTTLLNDYYLFFFISLVLGLCRV